MVHKVQCVTKFDSDPVLKVVNKRWRGSVGDGWSSNWRPRGDGLGIGYFWILPTKMEYSGKPFILFCTVNWLDA